MAILHTPVYLCILKVRKQNNQNIPKHIQNIKKYIPLCTYILHPAVINTFFDVQRFVWSGVREAFHGNLKGSYLFADIGKAPKAMVAFRGDLSILSFWEDRLIWRGYVIYMEGI